AAKDTGDCLAGSRITNHRFRYYERDRSVGINPARWIQITEGCKNATGALENSSAAIRKCWRRPVGRDHRNKPILLWADYGIIGRRLRCSKTHGPSPTWWHGRKIDDFQSEYQLAGQRIRF